MWFAALLGLAILGLYAVWRTSAKPSSVFAAFTGLWVLVLYGFLVPFGAPRYILPTFALFAILAADGIAWLVTKWRWRDGGRRGGVRLLAHRHCHPAVRAAR